MRAEIYWIEGVPAGGLAVLPRPRGGDWLEDEVRSLRNHGVDVLVSLLTEGEVAELGLADEAAHCAGSGIDFISFAVADREVPGSAAETRDLVRRLAALLASGKSVAVHCRQGVGRSALIAACVLASLGESAESAFERITRARGCPVPDTVEQRDWVRRFVNQQPKSARNPTLLLSTWTLPSGPALARAARDAGWSVLSCDDPPGADLAGRLVYYGRVDRVFEAAARHRLALLEPPLDLLTQLPPSLRLRQVEFARLQDLSRLSQPTFIKPADPLDRCFDAGTYADVKDIRAPRGVAPVTPVLIAEPVEWLAEFRCFVRDGSVVATSPYLSFGRPVWRAWGEGGEKAVPCGEALALCRRLLEQRSPALPPAFVVDVGLIEGRGWAVVEFNPAWCSGLLGADPSAVLGVLERACQDADDLDAKDVRWNMYRTPDPPRDRADG